jgi:NAD-dependent deacetylase
VEIVVDAQQFNFNPSNDSIVVVLTGAGISQESGIKTFREAGGLWEEHDITEVASPEGFESNPDLVYRFYRARRQQLQEEEIVPNDAHKALSTFERKFSGEFLLVTQNVDDLHLRAGSKNLLPMHGELNKMRCQKSEEIFPVVGDLNAQTICSCCGERGNLRPHIVWFGEIPLYLTEIFQTLRRCDYFFSIGTSGQVHPAASFVAEVPYSAIRVELNLEQTPISSMFNYGIYGQASETVPQVFL